MYVFLQMGTIEIQTIPDKKLTLYGLCIIGDNYKI